MDFLDCELYLTSYDRARLSIEGRDYSGRPALSEDLQRRLLEAELEPEQYGKLLFGALFRPEDDLLTGYREGLAIARYGEKRLRLRLHIDANAPASLHTLHWEELYDPKELIALGRSQATVFSRYATLPRPAPPPFAARPRLLVVVSSPADLSKYNLADIARDQTFTEIENALKPLEGQIVWEFLREKATPARLYERLLHGDFQALHIHAHGYLKEGATDAHLVLEDDEGKAAFVNEELFANIFDGERQLRLVTLIACHSGVPNANTPFGGLAHALVLRGCPAVVAMRRAVSVEVAALFTRHFYSHLARTGHVDTAVSAARQQIYLTNPKISEWSIPTLYMRLTDAAVWTPTEASRVPVRAANDFPWPAILKAVRSGRIVPILGPDINRGLLMPAADIAARWAREYGFPAIDHSQNDLPRVAKFVETMNLPSFPHETLLEMFREDLLDRQGVNERDRLRRVPLPEVFEEIGKRHFDLDPEAPHRILAELPTATYITTNYDTLMTAALKWNGLAQVQQQDCLWKDRDDADKAEYQGLKGTRQAPLVFHLYGSSEPTSLVLTEDDFLEFLRVTSRDTFRIPEGLRSTLEQSLLLFLGFDVRDLNFRILFKTLIAQLREAVKRRIAVLQLQGENETVGEMRELDRFEVRYTKDLELRVYWGSVREFLRELKRQL